MSAPVRVHCSGPVPGALSKPRAMRNPTKKAKKFAYIPAACARVCGRRAVGGQGPARKACAVALFDALIPG